MKPILSLLSLLPILPTIHAICNVTGDNPLVPSQFFAHPLTSKYPVNLDDLRTATPYTWTLSALASGCDTDPTTFTNHYMWLIAGTPFPAINTITQTLTDATLVKIFETFTFPQMTVTSLYPGEPLSLYRDGAVTPVVYYVPLTALTATSTSTSSSKPTTSSTSTTSTSSSSTSVSIIPSPTPPPAESTGTNTSGIIAGSVVGGIAILAIIAFAWYKVKTHRPPPATLPYTNEETPPYQSAAKESFYPATAYEMRPQSGPQGGIKYPENISANLGS